MVVMEIKIFNPEEVTQAKGQMISAGTKESTLSYVQIPEHWVGQNIVLILTEKTRKEEREK